MTQLAQAPCGPFRQGEFSRLPQSGLPAMVVFSCLFMSFPMVPSCEIDETSGDHERGLVGLPGAPVPAATSCEGGPKTRPVAFSEVCCSVPLGWTFLGFHGDSIPGLAAKDGDM